MDVSVPQAEEFRTHALECLREAHAAEDRETSQVFHRLAMWWVILAHEREDDLALKTAATNPSPRFFSDNIASRSGE